MAEFRYQGGLNFIATVNSLKVESVMIVYNV